jgi:hypothetical protein
MTEPAAEPPTAELPDEPPAEVDGYLLALALNAVIANRKITAGQACAEMGVGDEKLSALRRRGEVSPGIALRMMAWLNLSPRCFQAAGRQDMIDRRAVPGPVRQVRIPADAPPAEDMPPRDDERQVA